MNTCEVILSDKEWDYFLSFGSPKNYMSYMLRIVTQKDTLGAKQLFRKLLLWYGSSTRHGYLSNINVLEPTSLFSPPLYRARIYDAINDSDWNKDKSNSLFKGYNQKESFVPPHENAAEGRANIANTTYLYAANNEYTAVIETLKSNLDLMSIARINIKEHLYILNFAIFYSCEDTGDNRRTIWIENFELEIANLFQTLATPGSPVYLLCQFISKIAIELHCHGLCFYSSKAEEVHGLKESINYVIFDYEKCEAVSSELRLAKDVIKIWRKENEKFEI